MCSCADTVNILTPVLNTAEERLRADPYRSTPLAVRDGYETPRTSTIWNMVYADDAAIVSRPPASVAKKITAAVEVGGAYELPVAERKTDSMIMRPTHHAPAICPDRAVRIPGWYYHGRGRHARQDLAPHGGSVERVSPLCQRCLRPIHHDRTDGAKRPIAPRGGSGAPAVRVQYLDATNSRI